MWMMGCSSNDGGGFINSSNSDSFNGRKLRPLIPRPSSTSTTTNNGSNIPTSSPPCLNRLHGSDLFLFNNHLATVSEQSKRELGSETTTTTVVSSRWNPTPEQLRTLEELYRRGTRTPTADQIQHITSQLRRYGKIEGKNVFYWFQNHKARERQKRRRRSSDSTTISEENKHQIRISNETDHHHHHHHHHHQSLLLERNESGSSSRTGYEVEQTKNWPLPTNCSTLPQEEAVSMQGAAAVVAAESRTNGWIQFEEEEEEELGELQLRRRISSSQLHATWHMMHHHHQQQQQVSSSSSSPPSTQFINTTTATPKLVRRTDPKLTNSNQNLSIIFAPKFPHYCFNVQESSAGDSAHTLELFPLRKAAAHDGNGNTENNGGIMMSEKEKEQLPSSTTTMNTTPYQFFEFL